MTTIADAAGELTAVATVLIEDAKAAAKRL